MDIYALPVFDQTIEWIQPLWIHPWGNNSLILLDSLGGDVIRMGFYARSINIFQQRLIFFRVTPILFHELLIQNLNSKIK